MLIYLHGFRSSPQSFKAQLLQRYFDEHGLGAEFACPQLPVSPSEAIAQLSAQFSLRESDTLVGSSLGGYYATWLVEHYGCRAVLINPAVFPARDLRPYVGPLRTYPDDQPMELLAEHIDELEQLFVPVIAHPKRYFLIAAQGDELLDWREMTARYAGARTIVRPGSDHGLSEFAEHVLDTVSFAGYPPAGARSGDGADV